MKTIFFLRFDYGLLLLCYYFSDFDFDWLSTTMILPKMKAAFCCYYFHFVSSSYSKQLDPFFLPIYFSVVLLRHHHFDYCYFDDDDYAVFFSCFACFSEFLASQATRRQAPTAAAQPGPAPSASSPAPR